MIGQFNQTLSGMVQNSQSQNTSQKEPDLTGADIDAMVANGEGGDRILAGMNRTIQSAIDKMRREEIDPLRNEGSAAVAQLAKQQMSDKLPHYKTYEKEINEQLSLLSPASQMNPNMIRDAHDFVVGKHVDDIIATTREQAIRQATEDGGTNPQGSGQGRNNSSASQNQIKPEMVLSDDAIDLLAQRGMTPESYATKMGFKSFDHFALQTKKGQRYANK